jgi:hypothetical protein
MLLVSEGQTGEAWDPSDTPVLLKMFWSNDVSKMLGKTFKNESLKEKKERKKKEKPSSRNSPSSCWTDPSDCYLWEHLKDPSVFISSWKWRSTLSQHFWCLLNHPQPLRDLWNGATVHDQTWQCLRWPRWRRFCAPIWIVGWLTKQDRTVIKLGTCIVNVLCQL